MRRSTNPRLPYLTLPLVINQEVGYQYSPPGLRLPSWP